MLPTGSGLLSQTTMPMSNTIKFNLINEKAELQYIFLF